MKTYFLGWDVGGWNCERNKKSGDALFLLTEDENNNNALNVVGGCHHPNLRPILCENQGEQLIESLLNLCNYEGNTEARLVFAIETPLGWPHSAIRLITEGLTQEVPQIANENPYLFRLTERFLAQHGFRPPLSVVRDMIGSQSLKGIHLLHRINAHRQGVGIWRACHNRFEITVIETYPSIFRQHPEITPQFTEFSNTYIFQQIVQDLNEHLRRDVEDALYCALLARLYALNRVEQPPNETPLDEGWIWTPPLAHLLA
jgi:hypothetical protein